MHNDLTPERRGEIGNERQKIGNWIGTGTTDTGGAAHAGRGRIHQLAFGDWSSTDGELTSHV